MKRSNLIMISGSLMMMILTSFSLAGDNEEPTKDPVKLTVIYGHPDDPAAFEEYYENIHRPIAEKIKGISRMEITKFENGTQGEFPEFYRMAELYFPSIEAMEKTLSSPEGKAAVEDIANFATGGVTILNGKAGDFQFRN